MCIIAVCEKRKLTREEISQIWKINSDGAGLGWSDGNQTHYIKGIMTEEELVKLYDEKEMPLPHVVHFRKRSIGEIGAVFTHPFICSPNSPNQLSYDGEQEILFHNGTWAGYSAFIRDMEDLSEDPIEGEITDSRLLAMARFHAPEAMKNPPGRVAIVKKDGIEKRGEFSEKEGVFFSNLFWEKKYGENLFSRHYSNVGGVITQSYSQYRGSLCWEDGKKNSSWIKKAGVIHGD